MLAAACAAATVLPAHADDQVEQYCTGMKGIAMMAITERQDDFPQAGTEGVMIPDGTDENLAKVIRNLIGLAYTVPVREDEASKKETIDAFAQQAYEGCVSAMSAK
jgi:hypothetical protein